MTADDDDVVSLFSDPDDPDDSGDSGGFDDFSDFSDSVGPPRRRRLGCLLLVVLLVVAGGGTTYLVSAGWSRIQHKFFYTPADYQGAGTGSVVIQVKEGDTATEIAQTLYAAGVIASVDAFTRAAQADSRSLGIQVGYYDLAKKMSANAALEILVNPKNILQNFVTVPEGLRLTQIEALLASKTSFSVKQWRKAIKNAQLPAMAKGSAEGFLFPATYPMTPGETPAQLIAAMVDRFNQAAATVGLTQGAAKLGNRMTPRKVVIVASIAEKEVRNTQDMPAVAEVIYNRLAGKCTSQGVPTGLLQLDSTVSYAAGTTTSGNVWTTQAQRDSNSPYNTYKHVGLPPGPISAPGEAALTAALNPTHDGWCFFVPINLNTGETKFAKTAAQHNAYVAELQQFCRKSDLC